MPPPGRAKLPTVEEISLLTMLRKKTSSQLRTDQFSEGCMAKRARSFTMYRSESTFGRVQNSFRAVLRRTVSNSSLAMTQVCNYTRHSHWHTRAVFIEAI